MNIQLKTAIEALAAIYEAIAPEEVEFFNFGSFEIDSLRMYFAAFLCYLSISDGEISWDECEVIEYYTGLNFAPDQISHLIGQLDVDNPEFPTMIPLPVSTFVKSDNDLFLSGKILDQYSSELFIEILKGLAYELVVADGVVTKYEEASVSNYITNIESYVSENLLVYKNNI